MENNTICVVGAGTMGRGIAYVAALGGYALRLVDLSDDRLEKARLEIERMLDAGRVRSEVDDEAAKGALERLSLHRDLQQGAAPAACVIEAVPETIELKIETFARLSDYCDRSTLLATNTSGLSITEIAARVANPGRVIGMHFFNPVPRTPLLEVVRGLETTNEAAEQAVEIAHRLGKETVTINESPGFVTTRMNAVVINEAFALLHENVATAEEIDQATRLGLNHGLGPFELADLMGLDTVLSILKHLQSSLGEKYRPNPLLQTYVNGGRLGRKVGKGVYTYNRP